MTFPLHFLPDYTLLCTFSSLKIPPHPKPSHCTFWNQQTLLILHLCLEHFFTSCFKEVCLVATCSGASGGNALPFVSPRRPTLPILASCHLALSLLQKFLLLRAPDNWMYYSIPMLVSIICQTLAHLQPRAEYFNSWFTNFPRTYLHHHFQCHHFLLLLNSLSFYPASVVKFQNLFSLENALNSLISLSHLQTGKQDR